MSSKAESRLYGRLTDGTIEWLARAGWPSRDDVDSWGRSLPFPCSMPPHAWASIRDRQRRKRSSGKKAAVAWEKIELFSGYLRAHGYIHSTANFAEFVDKGEVLAERQRRRPSLFGIGWRTVLRYVRDDYFLPNDVAFCGGADTTIEQDVMLAAREVMVVHGRNLAGDASVTEDEAINIAEGHMRRGLKEFYSWLLMAQVKTGNAVMFTAIDGTRAVVHIAIPLTHDAYDRFRRGDLWDHEITEADVTKSDRILILAQKELPGLDRRLKARLVWESLFQGAYQVAAISPPSNDFTAYPLLMSFAGAPAVEPKLVSAGFRPVGRLVKSTDMPIYEIARDTLIWNLYAAVVRTCYLAIEHRETAANA